MPRIFESVQEQTSHVIQLGRTVDGHEVYMLPPEKEGQQISNTVLLVGMTGSGKTNMKKVMAVGISKRRPVYLFDPPGRDDYLMYHPNNDGTNFPPGLSAKGMNAIYYFYSTPGGRQKEDHEKGVRPNFAKYNIQQMVSLGISPGAAIYLQNVIAKYGPFKSFESLYEFIESFPTTEVQCNTMIKNQDKYSLQHNKFYEQNDKIPTNSKDNLTKILPFLLRLNLFRMDNKEEIDYERHYRNKDNLVFCYNDKSDYYPHKTLALAKVEINYAVQRLDEYRDKNRDNINAVRPFLFIDEAHKIFTGESADIMAAMIEDFILVCRKLSVGICLSMPDVTNLNDRVLSDIKDKISYKYKGKGAKMLIRSIGVDEAWQIPHLKFNRYTGERQVAYYNEDFGNFFIIEYPYEAPCGIHREWTEKKKEEDDYWV